ncbi:MAG: hypothetical protein ACLSHW_05010 [Lachnospiraceae bacterium]
MHGRGWSGIRSDRRRKMWQRFLLHLKKNQDDYQAFVEKLQDESVTVGEEDGVSVPSSDRF